MPLSYGEIKELSEYKQTIFDLHYLTEVACTIDPIFRKYEQAEIRKQQEEASKN